MKIVGVIAEFNPFHNGHARLLSHAKKELGADYVIAVMSGDFVQRGEPACQSRLARAHEALAAGFDAVISLPVGISTASAEGFSRGGVRALDSLGCVDMLLFGSEAGNLSRIESCAAALLREDPFRAEVLKNHLKEGLSYPAARALALPEFSDLLGQPNNILAIEYCKALQVTKSALRPETLLRPESYHESQAPDAPSAESIRKQASLCMKNRQASAELDRLARRTMPAASADIFLEDIRQNGLPAPEDFSLLLAASLFKAVSFEDFLAFAGVTEDLARRIFEARSRFAGWPAFAESVRSRNTTMTAVSRALLSILLEIPKGAEASLPYLRILGYRKDAQPLLQKIAANASVPVLYRIAEAEALAAKPAAKTHLRREIVTQSLYEVVRAGKAGRPPRPDHLLPVLRV